MSRKDSVFPNYVPLKVDPNDPPADVFERGSRRCQKCGTQWPNYGIFSPTPCCGSPSQQIPHVPHMTWKEAVKKLLHARFERYYTQWNDDVTDEAIVYDESIEVNTPIDPEMLAQGLTEIERIVGDRPKSSSTEL
jgi:hypothetical protein